MADPAPTSGQLRRRLAATAAASLLASSYGLAIGWATVANWQLQLPEEEEGALRLDASRRSWLLSALYAGVAVGSPLGGRLGGWLGPRGALLVSVPVLLASSAVIFFAESYEVLMTGRVLSGLGVGMPSAVYMLYISGTSRPSERGLFSTLSEVCIVSGTVLAVAAGQVLHWRWLAVLCAALASVPPAALLALLPADPVWLLTRGRGEQAGKAAELLGLKLEDMGEGTGSSPDDASERAGCRDTLRALTERRHVAPLMLVLALFFFRAFSGYYGILAYSLEFFREVGLALDASLTSLLFGAVAVLAAVITSLLIDRVGRRPLLLVSAAGTGLCYLGLVLVYKVPALRELPALPVVLLLSAGLLFYVGLGCVPYCLVGELFPAAVRPLGNCLMPVAYCLFSGVALLLFPLTVEALGPSGLFLCHAACMAAALLVVLLVLPETRGLPLAAAETMFQRAASSELDKKQQKCAEARATGIEAMENGEKSRKGCW